MAKNTNYILFMLIILATFCIGVQMGIEYQIDRSIKPLDDGRKIVVLGGDSYILGDKVKVEKGFYEVKQ